jgi:hypothetical protein
VRISRTTTLRAAPARPLAGSACRPVAGYRDNASYQAAQLHKVSDQTTIPATAASSHRTRAPSNAGARQALLTDCLATVFSSSPHRARSKLSASDRSDVVLANSSTLALALPA